MVYIDHKKLFEERRRELKEQLSDNPNSFWDIANQQREYQEQIRNSSGILVGGENCGWCKKYYSAQVAA